MLINLKITNLALIQNCEIDLADGFSVFTGETGAGKSVLMSSIGLLLGNRAISEQIRYGEDKAEVVGSFLFKDISKQMKAILDDQEIAIIDGELIVRRIITRTGRNKAYINQVPVPLTMLKILGETIIDLHGQHDHQALLREEAPYEIIDILKTIAPKWRSYQESWKKMQKAQVALNEQRRRAKELLEKKEFLLFQYEELAKLELKEGEEEELNEEYKMISSVTDRSNLAGKISSILDGHNESLTSMVSELLGAIEKLSDYDPNFKQWGEDVLPLQEMVSDLSTTITSYSISLREEANPSRVDYINGRISKIQRLKKKYICDFDELITKRNQLAEELSAIENSDSDAHELEKALKRAKDEVVEVGNQLTIARVTATKKFDTAITKEMSVLGFRGGGFKTELVSSNEPTVNGLEELLFTARTNAGETFMPLYKTASGGEISRIMLAIKTILAEADPVPILVFDEIDTGVGGEIASDIASAMVKLANHHQIFVISHLQQIAVKAENHYIVYKEQIEGRTVTRIEMLSKEEQVEEIARMLGGKNEAARRHAEELLLK